MPTIHLVLGHPGGPNKGWAPQKTSLAPTPTPASQGPSDVFLLYKNQVQVLLLFLPEAKLLLYFLELLIVNLRVLREAKYIPCKWRNKSI